MEQSFNDRLWAKKYAFFATFFLVFTISYVLLLAVDFFPEPVQSDEEMSATTTIEELVTSESPEAIASISQPVIEDVNEVVLPESIYIKRLNKTINIENPISRTIADLDAALLDGVVRHPDSAHLEQEGNVFILGHSSYLPNVLNPNFQAFNGIQNLEWGDEIEITSANQTYVYRVDKVYQAEAQSLTVPIAGDEKVLTLATCNSFGSIDDRYIVEASQVEVRAS